MKYYGGCDSGSTYTKCVILDETGKMVADVTLRSRINSVLSAQAALDEAVAQVPDLKSAKDLAYLVGTGYGRNKVPFADENISEISCHAMGVHVADPSVRSIIDIGGQDVKGIAVDTDGTVLNFAMNDKCAAGTGRFFEAMAKAFEMDLTEFSKLALRAKNVIPITAQCTVFAESEVVSLVAQNKDVADIIHGLNVSVASKVGALAARLGKKNPGEYMMTGGVAKNPGIIKALEEKLDAKLYICDEAQLCGALGAALFAYEKCSV